MSKSDLRKAFLVSLPRSGSTMLQRLLAGHSRIISPNEPWILLRLLYPRRWGAEAAAYDTESERIAVQQFLDKTGDAETVYAEAVRLFADRLYEAYTDNYLKEKNQPEKDGYMMLDKTPRYYLVLPELRKVYPKAPIILLKRNPLAILASMVRTWTGLKPDSPHFSNILPDLLLAIDQINDFAVSMETDPSVVAVKYEDLIENPEKELKLLCAGLDIPFEKEMLSYSNSNETKGILGDKANVDAYSAPEKKFAQQYKTLLSERKEFQSLSVWYLLYTGTEAINTFGYDSFTLLIEVLENKFEETCGNNFVHQINGQTGGQLLNNSKRMEEHFCKWTEMLLQKNELRMARRWIQLSSGMIQNMEFGRLYTLMLDAADGDSSGIKNLTNLGSQTGSAEVANKAAVFLSQYKLAAALKSMRNAASLAPDNEEIQTNLKALQRLRR